MGRYKFFEDEETGHRFTLMDSRPRYRTGYHPNAPSKVDKRAARRPHSEPTLRDKVSPATRAEVLAAGRCAMCGATRELTVDHIIPCSKGGGSHRANLQCLCGPCNRWKDDELLSPEQFRQLPNKERKRIKHTRRLYHIRAAVAAGIPPTKNHI